MLAITGLWQLENYRGAKILEDALARLASHPGPVGYRASSEVIPEDEDNFFAAPLVSSLVDLELDPDTSPHLWSRVIYNQPKERARLEKLSLPFDEIRRLSGNVRYEARRYHRYENDLKILAACYRNISNVDDTESLPSVAILKGMMDVAGEEIEAFETAAKRPSSYLPSFEYSEEDQWSHEFTPAYGNLWTISNFFTLRMIAALHSRDLETYRVSFEVCEKIELGIFSQLNIDVILFGPDRISGRLDTIWMGIEQEAFNEDDLKWLYDSLRELKLSKLIQGTFAEISEKDARGFSKIKQHRAFSKHLFEFSSSSPGTRPWVSRNCPDGWIDRNVARLINWNCDEGLDPWHRRDFSGIGSAGDRRPGFTSPSDFLLLPAFDHGILNHFRLAELYVRKSHAELACLLELYRLEHGKFPEVLEELCPGFIASVPIDPFDGLPMKYRAEDGTYSIYSVGPNLIDDGGVQERKAYGHPNMEEDDWVWYRDMEKADDFPSAEVRHVLHRIKMEKEAGKVLSNDEFEKGWHDHLDSLSPEEKSSAEVRRALIIRRQFERIEGKR